jgi:hypothetical protein
MHKIKIISPIISALIIFGIYKFYLNNFLFNFFPTGIAISLAAALITTFILHYTKGIQSAWLYMPIHITTAFASILAYILFITLLGIFGFQ